MTWEKKERHEQWQEWKMGPDIHIRLSKDSCDPNPWHWSVMVESMERRQMLQMNGYAPTEAKGQAGALLCVAGFALALRAAGDTLEIPTADDKIIGALLFQTLTGKEVVPE